MLNPRYNMFRDFIDVVRKEVGSGRSVIIQITSGMCPYTKRFITRLAQDRTSTLYNRFTNNPVTVQELVDELSFFCSNRLT